MSNRTRHRYTPMVASLWDELVSATERATRMGALVSVPTERTIVEDGGISFAVHVTALQEQKVVASSPKNAAPTFNPFLPPDPDLVVSGLGARHLCILNKFNVIPHHLLIVTRDYEPQEALLDVGDFAALLTCMNSIDGLGFYNGGTVAGASQSHRHLQLVPLPLGEGPRPTPIDSVIDGSTPTGELTRISAFDFSHALIPLGGTRLIPDRAAEMDQHYRRACAAVGVHDETKPYNLLITRRWMLMVPRSREHWSRASLNALAFAGSLLVPNRTEYDKLVEIGPLAVMKTVVDEDVKR